jgi:hypothetical protein
VGFLQSVILWLPLFIFKGMDLAYDTSRPKHSFVVTKVQKQIRNYLGLIFLSIDGN